MYLASTHITFQTADFRQYASTDGPALIAQYDDLVYKIHRYSGLYKYNRPVVNRSYFHAVYKSYLYATSYRTCYNVSSGGVPRAVCDVAQFRRAPWGKRTSVGTPSSSAPILLG